MRLQATERGLPLKAATTDVTAIDQRLVTAEASLALAATATDLSNTQAVAATNLALLNSKASINSVLDLGIIVTGNAGDITDVQTAATALATRMIAAETSLVGKQDTLTGTADVPTLDTALVGKQATLTHPGDIPGMTAVVSGSKTC